MIGTKNTIMGVTIAVLIGAAIWAFNSWQNALDENKRMRANYESSLVAIEGQSNKNLAEFTFKKNRELKEFIELNNHEIQKLKLKLEESTIKINRISKIVSTDIRARDTVINRINLDSLSIKIAQLKPFNIPFVDSTKCFYYKMELVYDKGMSQVNVLERRFNETTYDVTTWERNKWKLFGIIPTRIFGKKIYTTKVISDCADTKTLILNKE